MENPYSPPNSPAPPVKTESSSMPLVAIARPIFLSWEKLRLIYCAILVATTLFFGLFDVRQLLLNIGFWIAVVEGAIVANVCYFAGPVIETYASWLGFQPVWLRMVLFIPGTLFSCLLVLLLVSEFLLPNLN